jgi:peroxiredoxin
MLEDELTTLRTLFESDASPEDRKMIRQRITDLVQSGQAELALLAGDRAPRFVLPDTQGILHSSERMLGKGPLVVIFYRGVWCAYCAADLRAIESVAASVRALGASLVAISEQTRYQSRRFKRENKLGFPILSDEGGGVTQSFGLRWTLPDGMAETHQRLGVDLAQYQGQTVASLPIPARYVIAQDGIVAYADVDPDYTRRPDPSDLLIPLRALKSASQRTGPGG